MTEVIHYKNRAGEQKVIATEVRKCPSPESKRYHQRYAAGKIKPYYPVPAIFQRFEFGWNVGENEPVLIHFICGSYEGASHDG